MSALPRPALPAGAVRDLFDALHELHHRAGWPSLRDMAREVGCSHTTVSAAFAGPRVPRWGLLELIVETLGGDVEGFHRQWLTATIAESPPAPNDAPVEAARAAVSSSAAVPHELPADVVGFTGREESVQMLDQILDRTATPGPASAIAVVSGTAGVGKTALALHWAHRKRDRFPNGEVYLDLRGYDPGAPVSPTDALEALLRSLGVPGTDIPTEQPDRAARYRTVVAARRMLVFLDNARSAEQVRDLLPGTPSCFVLVTSRHAMPGLVARHGAQRIDLDLLSRVEAHLLLRRTIGSRVDAEPGAAHDLADRCARLPLALRICGELAASRRSASLQDLVVELADAPRRLDLLGAGEDDHTAVRTVFSWSVAQLEQEAHRMFCLLGAQPGSEFDSYAVAALAGTDLVGAHRLLDGLTRAHLVEEIGGGRFRMHDLLRDYAAERALGLSKRTRLTAVRRLLDYYLHTAQRASAVCFPTGRASGTPPTLAPPAVTTASGAGQWLDTEWPNLLAAAVDPEAARYTVPLATALSGYIDSRARYSEGMTLYEHALTTAHDSDDLASQSAALDLLGGLYRRLGRFRDALVAHQGALQIHRQTGDAAGQSTALIGIGVARWRCGQYMEALHSLQEALAICRQNGDLAGEGNALNNLGVVFRRLGRYPEAVEHYVQSRACHRATGDSVREAGALNNLGIVHLRLGEHTLAQQEFQSSLAICREQGDRVGVSVILTNLGESCERLGRYADALAHASDALEITRLLGYRIGEGEALRGMGVAYARLGRHDEAVSHLREAVSIGSEIDEALVQTAALNDLGEVLLAMGMGGQSREYYDRGLALARGSGDQYEQGRAHSGLGDVLATAGLVPEARSHWEQSLALFAVLGVPEADVVRAQLSSDPTTARSSPRSS